MIVSHNPLKFFTKLINWLAATGARRQDYLICINFGDIIAGGVVTSSILVLIISMLVCVILLLIRSKRLLQKELKESQDNREKDNTVYEEVPASIVFETTENTAYTCTSRVCANASL